MKFEWDSRKSKANLQKHGLSFDEAKEIFFGKILTKQDSRNDYGEDRYISIGAIEENIAVVVVHTDRAEITRIISARLANKTERKTYYDYIKGTS
jgi:hypothetical protein